MIYTSEKTFEKIAFSETVLKKGEYENCRFLDCDFASADISAYVFIGCEFIRCNLSLAEIKETVFQDIEFSSSKMIGLKFDECSQFALSFSFNDCILDHVSFSHAKIKGTHFKNSRLKEADFTQSDLTSCVFENCDLSGSVFDNSILEKADLRSAVNYNIDPERNKIKKAQFNAFNLSGLLSKYDIRIQK